MDTLDKIPWSIKEPLITSKLEQQELLGKREGRREPVLGCLKMIFSMSISMCPTGVRILLESISPPLPKTRSPGPCGTADVTVESSNFLFESLEKKVGKEMEQMKQQIRQLESPKEQER